MDAPLVYVLIPNWNGRDCVLRCVQCALALEHTNTRIVVIDNASDDDSLNHLRPLEANHENFSILPLDFNAGWSGAINAGLEVAQAQQAPFALLLNNDSYVEPDCLALLIDTMRNDDSLGALAPKLVFDDAPWLINSIGITMSTSWAAWDIGFGRADTPEWNAPQEVLGVCGAGLFLRMDALDQTGPFPNDFTVYSDDLDLCLRLWDAGYRIESCPSAVIRHGYGSTMGTPEQNDRRYILETRNRYRLWARNAPRSHAMAAAWGLASGGMRELLANLKRGRIDRVLQHLGAATSALGFLPQDAAHRKRREPGRFWHLVRNKPAFFEGIERPQNGWYAADEADNSNVFPMGSRATIDVPHDGLAISILNCYPPAESLHVHIESAAGEIHKLEAKPNNPAACTLPAGRATFHARQILRAETTGAGIDIGAWVQFPSEYTPGVMGDRAI